jgi:ATP-dependent Clp protease ATP-binding subunit ClpA
MNNLDVYRERFGESGFRVFELAIEESRRRNQNYVSLGHILVALAAEDGGSFKIEFARMRADHGLMADAVSDKEAIEKIMEWSPKHDGQGIRIGPDTKKFLGRAIKIARSSQRAKIEAADLLAAFLQIAPIAYVRPHQGARFGS